MTLRPGTATPVHTVTTSPSRLRVLLSPLEQFLATESASGIILIAAALAAFIWANSPWAEAYAHLQHVEVGITVGSFSLHLSLAHWVNDGLMAIFFFVVGLEIKRELVIGELAGWQRAALPIVAALGGMVVPAVIYAWLNLGLPSIVGWGVPMATDIAFAVGILALLGPRVPLALKVFLLALAIVDDLGAVLVIALFYTGNLSLPVLGITGLIWFAALAYGHSGGGRPAVFLILGLLLWYFMHASGVHATVAGVLLALAVPLGRAHDTEFLKAELAAELGGTDFEATEVRLEHLENVISRAQSPLHEFERTLQPWVAFAIMPIFALCNAGVTLGGEGGGFASVVTLGAFLGLLLGKPIGITLFVVLAGALGITRLPAGVGWAALIGVGFLAGIGFTMALFIAMLAFGASPALDQAKIGVLTASICAAVIGYFMLRVALPLPRLPERRATSSAPLRP
jgi:NhaA family Na+:H+ antiporter